MFGFRLAGAALTFAIQLVVARVAGPHELGLYVYALSGAMLISVLAGLGYPQSGIRFLGAYLGNRRRSLLGAYVRAGRRTSFSAVSIASEPPDRK